MIRSSIVTIYTAPPDTPTPPYTLKLDEIIEKLEDPKVPEEDVLRLITIQIALICEELAKCVGKPNMVSHAKWLMQVINACNALEKNLARSAARKRGDELNLYGPKFGFVYWRIVEYFKQALKETKLLDITTDTVMKIFHGIMNQNLKELGREVAKIETLADVPEKIRRAAGIVEG